jgi:hypothetical protein
MAKIDDTFEEPASEEAPLLTPAEITKIKEQARAEILATKKADLRKKLLAEETQRLRNEEGLTTGNRHADEIVAITVDVASFAPHICINGQAYWHGKTYMVPRHVADTLREQMWNTWRHQAEIDGKSRAAFYAEKHVADLYKPGNKGTVLSGKAA